MLFETGLLTSDQLHSSLRNGYQQWLDGNVFAAFQTTNQLLKSGTRATGAATGGNFEPFEETDWIFISDLTQATSRYNRARALHKRVYPTIDSGSYLGLMMAWDLSAYGESGTSHDLITKIKTEAPSWPYNHLVDLPALCEAMHAYNYSMMGWLNTAVRHHQAALEAGGGDGIVLYVLSRAAAKRTEWNLAIELGQKCLKVFPHWARACGAVFDSLNSVGELERGRAILNETKINLFDARLEFFKAIGYESAGDLPQAIEQLRRIAAWNTSSRMFRFGTKKLLFLLLENDRIDEARELVKSHGLREFDELLNKSNDNNKRYISVPLISQTINHCVPTVAAMVAGAQGVAANALEYANAMGTRNGTPLWRMVDHMAGLGFRCYCVLPQPEIVEKVLDQNVPLIGSLAGLFSGHVDVVCGYNQRLQIFHIRDPMHWYGNAIGYEFLAKRYEGTTSLWVMVAPSRIDEVKIDDSWLNEPGQALIDLARACSMADRAAAEAAYAGIPEDSSLGLVADSIGLSVVITPKQYAQRLRKHAQLPDDSTDASEVKLSQIQAMLRLLDEENADEIVRVARANEGRLSKKFVEYVEAQALFAKGQWQDALHVFSEMTRRWPGMDSAWGQLSDIYLQLGDAQKAEQCLNTAIEIATDNDSFRIKWMHQNQHKMTYQQRLEYAQKLVKRFDNEPYTRMVLADVLEDAPQGLDFEAAHRECIKFFPRNPSSYAQLTDWYIAQGRADLAKAILAEGRELIGLDELPLADFELAEPSASPNQSHDAAEAPPRDESSHNIESPNRESHDHTLAKSPTAGHSHVTTLVARVEAITFKMPHTEFSQNEAVMELSGLLDQQRLSWWQAVRFVALRITNLVADLGHEYMGDLARRRERLASLLPSQPPGVPETFCEKLFNFFPAKELDRDSLQMVVEWSDRVAPAHAKYPALGFERAYLIELCGRLNESEAVLREIVENHPAYSPAYFRLAQIEESRSNLRAAYDQYLKCLEVEPGHAGSLSELARLNSERDPESEKQFLLRLADRLPYSIRHLHDAMQAVNRCDGTEPAVQFLQSRKSRFSSAMYRACLGRFYVEMGAFDKALKTVGQFSLDEDHGYALAWIQVDCAVGQEHFGEAKKLTQAMLDKWPDDRDLIDQMARILRTQDVNQAKQFAYQKLLDGVNLPLLAYVVFQDCQNQFDVARGILEQAKPEHREPLALALFEALNQNEWARDTMLFLEYCAENLPHLTGLRAYLAGRYTMVGQTNRGIAIAKSLLDSAPENPEWMELYAECIQDVRPTESVELLKKVYSITGTASSLSRLARGYHAAGNRDLARATYFETLALNPMDTVAMTNLMHLYGVMDESMFAMVNASLDAGQGCTSQYFHVMAVKIALQLGRPVSRQWAAGAVERFLSMDTHIGFANEKKLLVRALAAWATVYPEETPPTPNFIARLISKFWWPKTNWIPLEIQSANTGRERV